MEFMASSRAMEECFFLSVGPRFVCITQKRMQMGDTIHILPLVLLINRGGQLRRRLLASKHRYTQYYKKNNWLCKRNAFEKLFSPKGHVQCVMMRNSKYERSFCFFS